MIRGLPWGLSDKESTCQCRNSVPSLEDPRVKEMATDSSTLIQEIHGQRSRTAYSPCPERVRHDLVTKQKQYDMTGSKVILAKCQQLQKERGQTQ